MQSEISKEAQAILNEMKPLGQWLRKYDSINRALGRAMYSKKHGYDALRELDKEWNEKYSKFNNLSRKYKKLRTEEVKRGKTV